MELCLTIARRKPCIYRSFCVEILHAFEVSLFRHSEIQRCLCLGKMTDKGPAFACNTKSSNLHALLGVVC